MKQRRPWSTVLLLVAVANARLYGQDGVPTFVQLSGDIAGPRQRWHYTTQRPAADWSASAFDATAWKNGPAPFGAGRPQVGTWATPWTTSDIWIRRTFALPKIPDGQLVLRLFHDENTQVFLNGARIATVTGYNHDYDPVLLKPDTRKLLREGTNTLAAHCRQTRGGQGIDMALAAVPEGQALEALTNRSETGKKGRRTMASIDHLAGHNKDKPWQMVAGHIATEFAANVTPDTAWKEYPRPQLVRDRWQNLNGFWDYHVERIEFAETQGLITAGTMTSGTQPDSWQGRLLVPFAIDSPLSGVMHILRPNERIWYRREFDVPDSWSRDRVLLHFCAVDWETTVIVNGKTVGMHRGGYDPFSFDITDALKPTGNELVVCAWDGTEQQSQAIGKQIMPENRKGFRYQPTGGIWQTVWLEPVPGTAISALAIVPDVDACEVRITPTVSGPTEDVRCSASVDGVGMVSGAGGEELTLQIPQPRLWSPDDPFLYDLDVTLSRNGTVIDTVASYVGMRKVHVAKADDGFVRIHLNNSPIFQYGPLDQGYWPDGILTPPSDEAAEYDVAFLKKIGCNMVRVHIKTHPDRWYYHCDRLGLLVWQDMICMPKYGQKVNATAARQWEAEFDAMIGWLGNHPSVIMWVPFNEGWSQFDTPRIAQWVKQRDPTRLVNNASGWTDHGVGDILDEHDYLYYPAVPDQACAGGRAVLLGEAGGLNQAVPGHTWYTDVQPRNAFDFVVSSGRATAADAPTMEDVFGFWTESLRYLNAGAGLNAVVYTQITDVEHELNGYLTYDRKTPKFPVSRMRTVHDRLYAPPRLRSLSGTGAEWRYSAGSAISKPRNSDGDLSGAWAQPDFDDSRWRVGQAPFGTMGNDDSLPCTTRVSHKTLYLRRQFELDTVPNNAAIHLVGKGVAHVSLNGQRLRTLPLRARSGDVVHLYAPLRLDELALLKKGRNTVAIAQPGGPPPHLDAELVEAVGESLPDYRGTRASASEPRPTVNKEDVRADLRSHVRTNDADPHEIQEHFK